MYFITTCIRLFSTPHGGGGPGSGPVGVAEHLVDFLPDPIVDIIEEGDELITSPLGFCHTIAEYWKSEIFSRAFWRDR